MQTDPFEQKRFKTLKTEKDQDGEGIVPVQHQESMSKYKQVQRQKSVRIAQESKLSESARKAKTSRDLEVRSQSNSLPQDKAQSPVKEFETRVAKSVLNIVM